MKYTLTIILASVLSLALVGEASAGGYGSLKGWYAHRKAQTYAWHGDYYEASWGVPVAVLVPPTAESQTKLGWGVGGSRTVPIEHQFSRNYPGPGTASNTVFRSTPRWPSDTDQFGAYYVRGPWK